MNGTEKKIFHGTGSLPLSKEKNTFRTRKSISGRDRLLILSLVVVDKQNGKVGFATHYQM